MKKKTMAVAALALFVAVSSVAAITEEKIFVPEINQRLLYSLSNNLDEIEQAIAERTGYIVASSGQVSIHERTIDLGKAEWRLNTTVLSSSVKDLMNKHNVNYSMAAYIDYDGNQLIVVNKRAGKEWYFWGYGGRSGYSNFRVKDAAIYSNGNHVLAFVETEEGNKSVAYYIIDSMYKNTVEASFYGGVGLAYGHDKLNGSSLLLFGEDYYFDLTIVDVDKGKDTITVQCGRKYTGANQMFAYSRITKFKRTNKYKGKTINIAWRG